MNIFRLAGDMTHLLSFLVCAQSGECASLSRLAGEPAHAPCTHAQVLLLKIHATKSCAGAVARGVVWAAAKQL